MKICTKCKQLKELQEFSKRSSSKSGFRSECKECVREYSRIYVRIKPRKHNTSKNTEESRKYVLHYLIEHPCVDCGEVDPVVLEFDHKVDKRESIAVLMRDGVSLSVLKNEIEKCEVRCASCHLRKTAND